MTALRILRLAPALLVALLLAAPAAAEPWPPADAAIATHEGTVQNVGLPAKLADHATRRSHRNASLEEFVSIDDDAEQDLTSPPVLRAPSALLLAAPAAAESWPPADAAIATHEGTVQNVGLPGKLADHATRRSHRNASLEEFVSIDDDAEQDLTSPPVLRTPGALPASAVQPIVSFYAPAPRTHRACAPFQTGPPHA